jgi:hypothetical protein
LDLEVSARTLMFWKCTGLENSQNQSLRFNRSHWIMEGSIPLIRGNRKINNWEKGCEQYSNFPTREIQIREEGDLDRQIMGHVDRRSNTRWNFGNQKIRGEQPFEVANHEIST